MTSRDQPRVARVAAAIGDPVRAAILNLLLDGRLYTATELAKFATIAPSTASQHLKVLLHEHLIQVRPQGRHRYYSLANADVGHALEALMQVAYSNQAPDVGRWKKPSMQKLRNFRSCYGHMAGKMGVWVADSLKTHQWIQLSSDNSSAYAVTALGRASLRAWGCQCLNNQTRDLYGCVDWSERREHFAGSLATELLDQFLVQGWARRLPDVRELELTPVGRQVLAKAFGPVPF